MFQKSLIKFIVETNQPFNLVEHPSFQEMVKLISKDTKSTNIPGRTQMTLLIQEEFVKMKTSLAEPLSKMKSKISLVIDCWTSSNQIPFQGVIGRFIDKNWNLITLPLDLTILKGPHTGQNIAHALLPVLDDFGIVYKIASVTTDNASNMDSFFVCFAKLLEERGHTFDVPNQRIRCLAHIVNLCAKDAILEFEKGEYFIFNIKWN